jgi:hypothetical protein
VSVPCARTFTATSQTLAATATATWIVLSATGRLTRPLWSSRDSPPPDGPVENDVEGANAVQWATSQTFAAIPTCQEAARVPGVYAFKQINGKQSPVD